MSNTPLGNVVSIRAEKNPKIIKNFSKEQKKIRSDWLKERNKKLKENPDAYKSYMENFQNWCKSSFSK